MKLANFSFYSNFLRKVAEFEQFMPTFLIFWINFTYFDHRFVCINEMTVEYFARNGWFSTKSISSAYCWNEITEVDIPVKNHENLQIRSCCLFWKILQIRQKKCLVRQKNTTLLWHNICRFFGGLFNQATIRQYISVIHGKGDP